MGSRVRGAFSESNLANNNLLKYSALLVFISYIFSNLVLRTSSTSIYSNTVQNTVRTVSCAWCIILHVSKRICRVGRKPCLTLQAAMTARSCPRVEPLQTQIDNTAYSFIITNRTYSFYIVFNLIIQALFS